MNTSIEDFLIVEAVCCRKWPVAWGYSMGRYCHERPVITFPLVVIREGKNFNHTLR